MSAAFETARDFAAHGLPVFPTHTVDVDGRCTCRKAACKHPGKHPRTPNGVKDATADERQLLHWNDRWPEANWAVACDRVAVIDVDPKHGGDPREVIAGHELGDRPGVWSGRAPSGPLEGERGAHIYCAGGVPGGNTRIPGVEIRGTGLYVMLPGSRHVSGVAYEWTNGRRPWNAKLEPIPMALAPLAAGRGEREIPAAGERIPHGARHNHLKDFAVRLARARVTDEETMLAHIRTEFEARCEPNPPPEPGALEALAKWAVNTRIADRERTRPKYQFDGLRPYESVESVGVSQESCSTDSDSPLKGKGSPSSPSPTQTPTFESESVESVAEFALPLDEFLTRRSEMPPALVGDEDEALLPHAGLAILFAKGGRGKTTLAIELGLHAASGVDWLGFPTPRPLRVLFIENEGAREMFRRKLAHRHGRWQHEITGGVFVHTLDWGAFSLADPGKANALRKFVENNAIDLVVGDPLDSLGLEGVGSPEETRRFMGAMTAVGLFRDVAFVLLHHPSKAEVKDELDEISGAWGGRPDTMLKLERLDGNRARLSFPKVRWSRRGTRPALILAFEPESETFERVAEEQPRGERDLLAEIVGLLAKGEWRTVKEIAAKDGEGGIGANVDAVKRVMEANPDRFVMRTGDDALKLGRKSPKAEIWQLADDTPDQTELDWQ